MKDEKIILIKLSVEEIKVINEVLGAFLKLTKIAPVKRKEKENMKKTNEALAGIIDKLSAKITEEEEKEKKNGEKEK